MGEPGGHEIAEFTYGITRSTRSSIEAAATITSSTRKMLAPTPTSIQGKQGSSSIPIEFQNTHGRSARAAVTRRDLNVRTRAVSKNWSLREKRGLRTR